MRADATEGEPPTQGAPAREERTQHEITLDTMRDRGCGHGVRRQPRRRRSVRLHSAHHGVNTGVRLTFGPNGDSSDGLPVTIPVAQYLANKEYTSQVLQPATGEKNESYAHTSSPGSRADSDRRWPAGAR